MQIRKQDQLILYIAIIKYQNIFSSVSRKAISKEKS